MSRGVRDAKINQKGVNLHDGKRTDKDSIKAKSSGYRYFIILKSGVRGDSGVP